MTAIEPDDLTSRTCQAIAQTLAAHLTMLSDASILDEPALAVLLGSLASVRDSTLTAKAARDLLVEFDERLDAISPVEVRGAARVGRGTADVLATVVRLVVRENLLELARAVNDLRSALLDLAATHVVSLVPAYAQGQPAQPTTFAHMLGGVISPLERAAARLSGVYELVDQSPMGAGSLASTGFEIDPARTAELLGFSKVIDNAFDAVSATDHMTGALDTAGTSLAPVSRFLDELLLWLRVQPDSVQLDEELRRADPALPQFGAPYGLQVIADHCANVLRGLDQRSQAVRSISFGPVGGSYVDTLLWAATSLDEAAFVLHRTGVVFSTQFEINRALLANRAGKGMITSSDLADFLILEEQLPPAAAQAIANRTIAMALQEGREASGITPELIDSAALLIIGRELRVEFETISRYLAPRRFIERRTLPGGPAPVAMRRYLEQARSKLETDQRWQSEHAALVEDAKEHLAQLVVDVEAERVP
jgi:argininosuccinate lyase